MMPRPRHKPYLSAAAAFEIGLRPMAMAEWLDIGADHAAFMAAKRARLAGCPPLYYKTLADSHPAQAELLHMVAANLTAHHPDVFSGSGDVLTDRIDGSCHRLTEAAREPLDLLGGLAEEDFVLFDAAAGPDLMIAASNAYSSSGRIVSCVGRGMHFAHEAVPGLNEALAARIDRVIANVQKDRPAVRFNWFVTPMASRLFPAVEMRERESVAKMLEADHGKTGDMLWLRVERQSFVRLPDTGALAFGIYTYSDPLSVIGGDGESLEALRRLLLTYSDARLAYGGMLATRPAILRWIDDRLAAF